MYDFIDCGYLDVVMGKMQFPFLWQKCMKECIGTSTTSVLVNFSPTEECLLERGLRQGDPCTFFVLVGC